MSKKIKFYIEGIHCAACKTIIETELQSIPGVKNINVNHQNGLAEIEIDSKKINQEIIFKNLEKLNYHPSEKELTKGKIKNWFPLTALILVLLSYFFLNHFGALELLSELNGENISLGLILLIGLLSGFHCVGMCSGLVIAYSTNSSTKTSSHLKYNLGRFISYTLIGGILGGLGSFFGINPVFTGTITIAAAIFMIILGITYVSHWPLLEKIKLHTPNFLAKIIFRESHKKSSRTPFIVGLLTGFMPCGPLQAIQLYALGTGSAWKGALAMAFFALGTSAVMIVFGLIVSSLSQKNIKHIIKISGILVILLGILMFSRGLENFNIKLLPQQEINSETKQKSKKPEYQTVSMELNRFGYSPNVIRIKPEIPVRWIINVKQMSGCTNAIQISSLGIKKDLRYGENIIEFTPPKNVDEIKFSCWMKMVWGKFVIDIGNEKLNNTNFEKINSTENEAPHCGIN